MDEDQRFGIQEEFVNVCKSLYEGMKELRQVCYWMENV